MRIGFDGKLDRDILKLAMPVVLAMLTQTAINLVDTIMVGRLPSSYSIAGQGAIALSLIVLWMFAGFLGAISVGTQAITARRFGENAHFAAGKVLTNSLIIAAITSTVFTAIAYLAMPALFKLLNKNPDVIDFGVSYSRIRILGLFSMVITTSFKSWFDGIGKTHVHMVAALVMNVSNILFNWLLIYGIWIFPKLYVDGAAWGSLASTIIGLFIVGGWTFFEKYRKPFSFYRLGNFDWSICREIVRLSLPSGLAVVFVMSGFALFLRIVSVLDAQEMAAAVHRIAFYTQDHRLILHALESMPFAHDPHLLAIESAPPIYTAATKIIIDILSLCFMSCLAFGTATATLVSQSLGRKDPDLAERYGWESAKLGMLAMLMLGAVGVFFPDILLRIFSKDVEVIDAARTSLRMMGISEAMIALGMIMAQALYGAGNSKFVMWAEMVLHFGCLVPLAYLFGITMGWGLVGIWGAALVYMFMLAVVMSTKFHEGKWKQIKI